MAKEQTSVRFTISSATLTAADVAARTGLVADESWKIGDVRGHFGNAEKRHCFVLDSKAPPHASLNDHVKAMLARLAPSAQKIGALTSDAVIEFTCVLHSKAGPEVRIERDDLRWLGVMGARLDIDVVILNDPGKGGGAKVS